MLYIFSDKITDFNVAFLFFAVSLFWEKEVSAHDVPAFALADVLIFVAHQIVRLYRVF